MFLLTILSMAVTLGILAYLFRFNLRERYHELRKRQIGGLAWYKITPEGARVLILVGTISPA